MTIEHIGEGTFIDTERIEMLLEGVPQANIYAYASFRSLEHVSFGLRLTTLGPLDDEIDHEEVGQYGMEPLASYWEFGEALRNIQSTGDEPHRSYAFEEDPLVEVKSKRDYDKALEALGVDDSDWNGPGLYDFRDSPPLYSGTVEEYELEELERAADEAMDFMFQGEEWQDAYRTLAEED